MNAAEVIAAEIKEDEIIPVRITDEIGDFTSAAEAEDSAGLNRRPEGLLHPVIEVRQFRGREQFFMQ
jgi:hypothetical protein